jgi:membrane protein involved in colicin uptake
LSSAGIKTDFKGKPAERGNEEVKKVEKKVENAEAGSTEDFDDFIQGLLSDMDEPATGSGGGKDESEDEVEVWVYMSILRVYFYIHMYT